MISLNIVLCIKEPSKVVQKGFDEFLSAMNEKGIIFDIINNFFVSKEPACKTIVVGTVKDYRVKISLEGNEYKLPLAPESLGFFRCDGRDGEYLVMAGADETGLMYLLYEMARKTKIYGLSALLETQTYTESPENQVRCMDRYLLGHLDNEWFLSEEFYKYYFLRLAKARFNRFNLILGFDTAYMSPPYPFFVTVKGFEEVRLSGNVKVSKEENLKALRNMVNACHQHGIKFVLATWQQRPWTAEQDSLVENLPESEEGLSEYCYSGILELLKAVPGIDVIQFRVNHESGVGTQISAEDFWKKCIDAVAEASILTGKKFTLDLRAKGLTEEMVDHAHLLGLDVEVPTKYWCEHAALPYHLSIMRTEELAQLDNYNHSRRYSYADMLQKPKKYDVIFRLWNYGSTNLFLWGDADYARRFSKSCSLSGSAGFQVNAPLSLKYGHELSHFHPWKVFNNERLNVGNWEEERFWLWYTLFGRLGYNTQTPSEVWESEFINRFGQRTGELFQQALTVSSRIIPLITTVHMPVHPSLRYWSEMNTGWALFAENNLNKIAPYDFNKEITYGSTEPSDHGLFYGINEFAHDQFKGNTSQGKYTPLQYAQWLAELSKETIDLINQIRSLGMINAEIEMGCLDMEMLSYLSSYHANKIKAAYALTCWRETTEIEYLAQCYQELKNAITQWSRLSELGKKEYYHDLDFSSAGSKTRRGTWEDLLPELENDLASIRDLMSEHGLPEHKADEYCVQMLPESVIELYADIPFEAVEKEEIKIFAMVSGLVTAAQEPILHYRNVNQLDGEFRTIRMIRKDNQFFGAIPPEQVTFAWDIMAYVSMQQPGKSCSLYPGLYHPEYPFPYAVIKTKKRRIVE